MLYYITLYHITLNHIILYYVYILYYILYMYVLLSTSCSIYTVYVYYYCYLLSSARPTTTLGWLAFNKSHKQCGQPAGRNRNDEP